MKAKKWLSLLSASALLLSLLSACGQGQSSNPSQPPADHNSAAPAIGDQGPVDGPSITTNGGEMIALSALEYQSDSAASTVYYISDITPEAMVAVYEALEWSPTGKVAVKLSTGEPPNSNYLRPAPHP